MRSNCSRLAKELRRKPRRTAFVLSGGEVPAMLKDELARVGVPPDAIEDADSETAAVRWAFDWAKRGDLLILLSHAARARTLAFLDRLAEVRWSPGAELPPS